MSARSWPFFTLPSDVHVPALQVTVCTRINGRVDERLDVPWQYDLFLRRASLGLSQRNRGHGKVECVSFTSAEARTRVVTPL